MTSLIAEADALWPHVAIATDD